MYNSTIGVLLNCTSRLFVVQQEKNVKFQTAVHDRRVPVTTGFSRCVTDFHWLQLSHVMNKRQ